MFNFFKKKPQSVSQSVEPEIRDVLFGDKLISEWPATSAPEDPLEDMEPWASFVRARNSLGTGHKAEAIQALQGVLAQPELESRHYLQAWHFLRELGVQPVEEAKWVYGVIVEVTLTEGLDIVAIYADYSARYFNYSGAAVIWDSPDNSLDDSINELLLRGQTVAAQIGPWEGPRPPAPPRGEARISMLTPSGLHFGQAEMNVLSADALGGPVLAQANILMQQLIAKTNNTR